MLLPIDNYWLRGDPNNLYPGGTCEDGRRWRDGGSKPSPGSHWHAVPAFHPLLLTKSKGTQATALLLFDQLLPFGISATLTFVHRRSPLQKTKELSAFTK